jgi:hypothetical protein
MLLGWEEVGVVLAKGGSRRGCLAGVGEGGFGKREWVVVYGV